MDANYTAIGTMQRFLRNDECASTIAALFAILRPIGRKS